MATIRKQFNFVPEEKHFETPEGVSETIPDMALTLHELLHRHTRGLEVPMFTPSYSLEEIPDINRMDLTEVQEYREYLQNNIDNMQEALQNAELAQQQQELLQQQSSSKNDQTQLPPNVKTEEFPDPGQPSQ